jgi:hypothetical protein
MLWIAAQWIVAMMTGKQLWEDRIQSTQSNAVRSNVPALIS